MSELNKSIQLVLNSQFNSTYWIVAEINEHKVNYSGHCYLELIEKDPFVDTIIAKTRATIWAGTYRKLLPYFETTTKHAFQEGIKVMIRASVEFHEIFGLSLNIVEIDPTYTLGDLEKQKQETIEKLKSEGVFNMNKETILPRVVQKIAIVSSERAAGFGDFLEQLKNNQHSFQFYCKLFPAVMQGENAEQSVINALEKIYSYENFFDVVVIIRGGGSKSDLSCFDKYWLTYHIAQFPIPVVTGIGHEQDDTIADMVAHTRLKTPTAVAAFIIDKAKEFEEYVDSLNSIFQDCITRQIFNEKNKLYRASSNLFSNVQLVLARKNEYLQKKTMSTTNVTNNLVSKKVNDQFQNIERLNSVVSRKILISKYNLSNTKAQVKSNYRHFMQIKSESLKNNQKLIQAFNPQNVLNRGFSVTYKDGKVIKDNKDLKPGDQIVTKLKHGKINSKIIK